MTERHLDRLVVDANGALHLLTSLADNFRAVEAQTSSFQAQCDHLLSEERRLQKLADEVGTDLHYYAYLDGVTRRLNAPGASRLVNHDDFGDILSNLDDCIEFMTKHVSPLPLFPPASSRASLDPRLTCDSLITAMPNHTWHAISLFRRRLCTSSKSGFLATSNTSPRRYRNKSSQPTRKPPDMLWHMAAANICCWRPTG